MRGWRGVQRPGHHGPARHGRGGGDRVGGRRGVVQVAAETCNYTECLHSISRNNDVVYHQNGVKISLSEGNLHHKSTQISSGGDKFGSYVQIFQEWAFENHLLSTSVRSYENMAIFTQHYPAGLHNVSLGNHVITKTNFPPDSQTPCHPPIILSVSCHSCMT